MGNLVQIRHGGVAAEESEKKQHLLFQKLADLPSLIVALSGGTDSAYLAWAAHQVLGPRALSITALSASFSLYDRQQLDLFLQATALRHEFIETHELENPAYQANDPDRCYFCKEELFSALERLARDRHFASVAYGVQADDSFDFRPGHRAADEHHVLAPLLEVQLHKAEIRYLAERAGIPSWDRPASACLASRLPHGTEVTPERLALVERGEAAVRDLGFRQFRVRLHGKLARLELAPEELPRALTLEMVAALAVALRAAGFSYVALDLEGYRQGSLSEAQPNSRGT